MREIKFRAWDKRKKQFISWEEIKRNTSMNLFGGYWELFNRNEFVPIQYTGIKDKNNKEIYEGDILRLYIPANDEIAEVEVFWDELQLRWATRYVKSPAIIDGNKSYTLPLCAFIHKKAEIIGNIYENPELIKETK